MDNSKRIRKYINDKGNILYKLQQFWFEFLNLISVVLVLYWAAVSITHTQARKGCVPYECLPICTKDPCEDHESTGGHGTGAATGAEGMGTDMAAGGAMSTKFARLLFMPMMPNPAMPHPMNPGMFYQDPAMANPSTEKYHGAQQWKQPYYYFMMHPRRNFIRYKRSAKMDKYELAQMAAKKVLDKVEEKKKKKEAKPSMKKLIKTLIQKG